MFYVISDPVADELTACKELLLSADPLSPVLYRNPQVKITIDTFH